MTHGKKAEVYHGEDYIIHQGQLALITCLLRNKGTWNLKMLD